MDAIMQMEFANSFCNKKKFINYCQVSQSLEHKKLCVKLLRASYLGIIMFNPLNFIVRLDAKK